MERAADSIDYPYATPRYLALEVSSDFGHSSYAVALATVAAAAGVFGVEDIGSVHPSRSGCHSKDARARLPRLVLRGGSWPLS